MRLFLPGISDCSAGAAGPSTRDSSKPQIAHHIHMMLRGLLGETAEHCTRDRARRRGQLRCDRTDRDARRWIAPSTPPPPSSERFAALTMASTATVVMSATRTSQVAEPMEKVRRGEVMLYPSFRSAAQRRARYP